jgi:hypothetical protein
MCTSQLVRPLLRYLSTQLGRSALSHITAFHLGKVSLPFSLAQGEINLTSTPPSQLLANHIPDLRLESGKGRVNNERSNTCSIPPASTDANLASGWR